MSLLNNFASTLLTVSGTVAPAVLTVFLISKNSSNNLPNLTEIPEIKVSLDEEEIKPTTPKQETAKSDSKQSSSSEEKSKDKEQTEEEFSLPSTDSLPPKSSDDSEDSKEKSQENAEEIESKSKSSEKSPTKVTGVRVIKSE